MLLPSAADNPTGLHRRYIVTKADGTPCDPDAFYFVLRLDSGGDDKQHIKACRAAARAYWTAIRESRLSHLSILGAELQILVEGMEMVDRDEATAHDESGD